MKRIFIPVIIWVFIWSGTCALAEESVKMACFSLPPHTYLAKDGKKSGGASVSYFENIASDMGYTVEWIGPLPFARLLNYLENGLVEGSIGLLKNNERENFLYYPDVPCYQIQSILVVKKDNPLKVVRNGEDIRGYRIGYQKGALYTDFLKENMDKLVVDFLSSTEWAQQNLQKLIRGRLDAIYDLNASTMHFEAMRLKLDDQVRILSLPEPSQAVYAVFSKKSGRGKDLLDKYNAVTAKGGPSYDYFLKNEFDNIQE